jgi:hypothetical protein
MLRFSAIALLLIIAGTTQAMHVDNFVLLDQHGDAHELYYHKRAPAVVIMIQANSCSAVHSALSDYQALREAFEPQGVKFFMLNSNIEDQRASIAAEAAKHGIGVPILRDDSQLIGESLSLTQAGEVLVLDPATWNVDYRGPISGAQAALQGHAGTATPGELTGCPVSFPQQSQPHEDISYSETIAPLLQDKCVMCHTEGGLGPWAMSSYTMIQGFAPMIREVVRTKRMPPWHADPHVGVWKNDLSLSSKETQALVHWIEAGAPRGTGPDPLAEAQIVTVEWPLGEPDLIVDIPAYTVPASGVVDYQFPTVKNPLDTGVWVKAATVVPGDREVVHHILAGTLDDDTTDLRRNSGVFDNYLIGYAPGNESHIFPEDTGVYIAPGGEFLFQLHYTPVGREAYDASRIGLYFHDKTPDTFFRQDVVVNPMIKIPPNAARHAELAYYSFDKPVLLHDLVPHAHYRGVASRFELLKPDGSKEVILNVPNYDFNWQRTYEFVVPRRIEEGTKLLHTTWYDNSAANPGNPDPGREVPWGLQSWDEMLYGAFSYTYVDESTEAPIHDKLLARTKQYVGFLDQNIDGKLSWRELPIRLKKQLLQGFKAVDSDGDGSLNLQEMHALTLRQQARRDDEAGAQDAGAD